MLLRLRAALIALASSTLLLVPASPTAAVTGGVEDLRNSYANVGLLVFYAEGGRFRCSGTLVSPTVVLTAAHCTAGTVGRTVVTFDPVIDREPPANLPRAADDTGNGQSATGFQRGQALPEGYRTGVASAHPAYSDFTDRRNWNDVGVVVLDAPVSGIAPAPLAPRDHLATVAPSRLSRTEFRLVGYGTEVRKPDAGPQRPTPMSFPIVRRYTDSVGQKLTPQVLQVNGNPNDTRGGGGTCFGDSGGPSFHDGYVTTVTSYVRNQQCRYLAGLQRVDVPVVQDWLATFGVRPAA